MVIQPSESRRAGAACPRSPGGHVLIVGFPFRSARPWLLAAWPVSCRNTSSRVGRRIPASCRRMPAPHRGRSTACSAAGPSLHRRPRASAVEPRPAPRARAGQDLVRGRRSVARRRQRRRSMRWPPIWRLELVGGALGDDPAVVDHGDVVGEPVGFLEVLGGEQHGGAAGDQVLDTSHSPSRLRGSSPVVGSSRKSTCGLVTSAPARSMRRRIPPGEALDRPVAGLGELEQVDEFARARRPDALAPGGRAGRPSRGSRSR